MFSAGWVSGLGAPCEREEGLMHWMGRVGLAAVLLVAVSFVTAKVIVWRAMRDWRVSRYELDSGEERWGKS